MLDVKQKRRIYDITNVLEGIGLIEKETKNTIKWKCVKPNNNKHTLSIITTYTLSQPPTHTHTHTLHPYPSTGEQARGVTLGT